MTLVQTILLVGLLVACCGAFTWLFLKIHRVKKQTLANKLNDREQILEMLTSVSDQSALSVYKNAYKIEDFEIAEKRN